MIVVGTNLQVWWAGDTAGVAEALGQIHTVHLRGASAVGQSAGVHIHLAVLPLKS